MTGQKIMRFHFYNCTGIYMVKTSPNIMYKIFGSELTVAIQECFIWAVIACVVKTLSWLLNSGQKNKSRCPGISRKRTEQQIL